MIPPAPWSSEELLLLNEELILALRSGVGLEVGLRQSSSGLGGRLGRFARDLSASLNRGTTLPEALAALDPPAPALYRVLVATGLRGQALEVVLLRMGEFARLMFELQQMLRRAMIYPWMVGVTAFVFSVGLVYFTVPPLMAFVEDVRVAPPLPVRFVKWLYDYLPFWSVGIVGLVGLWWLVCWGARRLSAQQHSLGMLAWAPGFGALTRWSDLARMSHLLAIQTEFGIPLPEALRSCRDVVQDSSLSQFCEQAANEVSEGRRPGESLLNTPGVPAFLKWTLSGATNQADLASNLRQAAEVYRERTLLRAEWLARLLPGAMAVVIGTVVVAGYAWCVMSVLVSLWEILL